MSMEFVNLAAYRFVELDDPHACRASLLDRGTKLDLRGTVLLSREGINLMLCGARTSIEAMKTSIGRYHAFSGMEYKESLSGFMPFDRMKVRIREEIISLGHDDIRPGEFTGPRIAPETLRRWLDEGRDLTLLDTRNDYETLLGSFEGALTLDIGSFRDFPEAVDRLDPATRSTPLVMFCTGGVRCEKASPLLLRMGFAKVYQLDGGILNYFRRCRGAHWRGECFVFDQRIGLTPGLRPTRRRLCATRQSSLAPDADCPQCAPDGWAAGTVPENLSVR